MRLFCSIALCLACLIAGVAKAAPPSLAIFDKPNLNAWCIVPFDKAKRGPEERAAMLEKLGLKKFVYDYRAEHVPTFDAELDALKKHGIELTGWWFPTQLNNEAKMTLELFKRHGVKPQLWVNGGGDFPKGPEDHQKRIQAEVERIRPIAEAAAAQGLTVGLYNHGGWFGEPETQLEIIGQLKMKNVGMVYNLHHGHDHIHRFEHLLHQMLPHLLCLNLNGMTEEGDKKGMLVMPIGQGEWDLEWLKIISRSGYKGPIGILNHTDEDAEERLQDNLDGLQWLVKQLDGSPTGPPPVPRSWKRPPTPVKKAAASLEPGVFGKALRGGRVVEGKPEYRTRPFTLECRAKLEGKESFNILVACDEKASGDHWELYTQAGSGRLALHQHGKGDRATAPVDVCDGQWHAYAAIVETERLRLYVDGKEVLDSPWHPAPDDKPMPGGLAFGRLVEGSIGCHGLIDDVRLSKGVREISITVPATPAKADAQTLGVWSFDDVVLKKPDPTPAAFLYNYDPLEPRLWPNRDDKVNRYRLYDFYAKEALHFMKQSPQPALVAAYPGLEGGRFGHWGVVDDEDWKETKWQDAERRPVQAAVLFAQGISYPKAVVMSLGAHNELTSVFDPLTLNFPLVAGDKFADLGAARHGFMNGLHLASPVMLRQEQEPPHEKGTVYHGFYRHGSRVIFSYRREGREMLDTAWSEGADFTRQTGPADTSPLRDLTKGGPAQWPQWLETQGELGTGKPYALDTLTLPKETPWRHPWFVSGHDFFANGDAAICTMTGEVWLVRGVDAGLGKLRWKRYASGLHHPLGLRIINGEICVQGRDQITRLHDLNGDDEADFYECVSNAQTTSPSGHDFITGCEYDGTYFYYASGNEGVCRVKPGSPVEVLGTGLRNPNGLGLARDGTLTTSVQEGDWTPASMILQIKPGGYYGHGGPKPGKNIEMPLAYLPRGMDNSAGGQCFAESDRWGPLGGQLLHFSPGSANHFLVLRQTVDNVTQGAVVCLPGDFLSGAQEGRINAKDGQLYVTGMYGWGCWGSQDGCFQRVRYTGGEAYLPVAFEAHENGVLLRFSDPLGSVASQPASHFAQCWNYHYSGAYGSAEYSVCHPDVEGHDTLEIKSAHVLPDGRSLFLEIPLLTPANQVHLHVGTTDKTYSDIIITAHRLAPDFTGFPGYQASPKTYLVAENARAELVKKDNPWAKGVPGRMLAVQAAQGLQYVQRELHARAGERLSVTFSNPDVVPHNWALIRPGTLARVGDLANKLIADPGGLARHYVPDSADVLVYADMTSPGGAFTVHFNAPAEPGKYPYLCTFPGHWMVMNGVLVVD
ncbi:MAG: putative heme-binding protein [Verrucomicrobiaceae bacterium]|nr:putative heme-binding protein [Verrucomicrobiaceae bacterium]